jgi:trk system potassium uptake protein TrkA
LARRSFAVIGLGRFGAAVARTLAELGHDVIGLDRDETQVQRIADAITQAMELDATDEKALRAAGVADVDAAVVSIGENIEASLLIVMLLKDLKIERVIAKATTELHGRILEKLGVTRVIFPERDMGVRLAHSIVLPSVVDYIELSRDFSLIEVPPAEEFVGKSLAELQLRRRLGLTVVAIKRRDDGGAEKTIVSPQPDEIVRADDALVLLGHNDALANIRDLVPMADDR